MKDPYTAAFAAAVSELADSKNSLERDRRKVSDLEALVLQLAKKVPSELRDDLLARQQIGDEAVKLRPKTGKEPYRELINVVFSQEARPWTVPEIHEELARRGLIPDNKFIATTLARLTKRGGLVRIARGRYLVRDYGVEIITSDEIDGVPDATRGCDD